MLQDKIKEIKKRKRFSFRDVSYRNEEKFKDTEFDDEKLPEYFNKQISSDVLDYRIKNDIVDFKQESEEAVWKLIEPISTFSDSKIKELSWSAWIMQRTLMNKLNPLSRN